MKIGIAYIKTKSKSRARNAKRKPKLGYHRQSTYKNRTYKYNHNGYYQLVSILGHEVVYDPDEILQDYPDEKLWYDAINIRDVKKYIDGDVDMINNMDLDNHNINENENEKENENEDDDMKNKDKDEDDDGDGDKERSNGHVDKEKEEGENKDDKDDGDDVESLESEDIDLPQVHFGLLKFECKWDNWPLTTWERWDVIQHTAIFEHYCEDKGWTPDAELYATIQSHSAEELQKIICNMAHFGNPTLRKALKLLVNRELNVW